MMPIPRSSDPYAEDGLPYTTERAKQTLSEGDGTGSGRFIITVRLSEGES